VIVLAQECRQRHWPQKRETDSAGGSLCGLVYTAPAHEEDAMPRRLLQEAAVVGRTIGSVMRAVNPVRSHQPSIRGRTRPTFRYGAPRPTRFPELEAHGLDGVTGAIVDAQRDRGRMLEDSKPPRRLRGEANPARDALRQGTLLDAKTGGLEVRSIPQESVEHPTEAVSDRDDRGLVSTSGTELQKKRMERMRRAPVRSSADPRLVIWP